MDFSEAIRMSERNLTDRTTPVELRQLACDLGALTPTAFLPILLRLGSRSLRDAGTVSEATADPSLRCHRAHVRPFGDAQKILVLRGAPQTARERTPRFQSVIKSISQ
jgi:hypothetical protein